jgi:NADH-quinone oxidoreductase subunit L
MQIIILAIILFPLLGALIAGFYGKTVGKSVTHWATSTGVFVALVLSCYVFKVVVFDHQSYYANVYAWAVSGNIQFNIGFMIDNLTAFMLLVVTFVSFLVHIYSIGYMHDDPGYQRFFSYISLFTFAMLLLVTANNFLQLFVGWEGVGLVSYLLIGFWFNRASANFGALKAFIVNRVGDFGFILGIAGVMTYFGSVDYATVFHMAPTINTANVTISLFANHQWSVITVICLLLFVGAMGKSAQVPLHVWLPESMEGPTPISALIHAATMVTAGIFMVARLSPLYEFSSVALSFIMIIGATTALFTGLVGIVQHDIKRVIAYSTLSQLGYMTAALGASAFAAGIFHLINHAVFKALLFLSAGAVIIAMHHEQDMRKMGGLRKYLPFTYVMFLIGALSLAAIPPFSGFYSKDAIIEAVHHANLPGAGYAYVMLLAGTFVTALYIFRALFLTFHAKERTDKKLRGDIKEPGLVVLLPLLLLSIPSVIIGAILAWPMLYSPEGILGKAIMVLPQYNTLSQLAGDYHNFFVAALHGFITLPCLLAFAGIIVAYLGCIKYPEVTEKLKYRFAWFYNILIHKYGFDDFNQLVFVRGTRLLAQGIYKYIDMNIIDNGLVNGSGRFIQFCSIKLKRAQSGYLYHYVLAMVIALLAALAWMLLT